MPVDRNYTPAGIEELKARAKSKRIEEAKLKEEQQELEHRRTLTEIIKNAKKGELEAVNCFAALPQDAKTQSMIFLIQEEIKREEENTKRKEVDQANPEESPLEPSRMNPEAKEFSTQRATTITVPAEQGSQPVSLPAQEPEEDPSVKIKKLIDLNTETSVPPSQIFDEMAPEEMKTIQEEDEFDAKLYISTDPVPLLMGMPSVTLGYPVGAMSHTDKVKNLLEPLKDLTEERDNALKGRNSSNLSSAELRLDTAYFELPKEDNIWTAYRDKCIGNSWSIPHSCNLMIFSSHSVIHHPPRDDGETRKGFAMDLYCAL